MAADVTLVDCSYHEAHERFHVPHPVTGRLVCSKCHELWPNAAEISPAMRRAAQMGVAQ